MQLDSDPSPNESIPSWNWRKTSLAPNRQTHMQLFVIYEQNITSTKKKNKTLQINQSGDEDQKERSIFYLAMKKMTHAIKNKNSKP